MANTSRSVASEPRRAPPPRDFSRPPPRPVVLPPDARRRAGETAAQGIHPAAIRLAVYAVVWLVLAMVVFFSGTPEIDYLLAIVAGLGLVFFGLILGLGRRAARDPRWRQGEPAAFASFLAAEVAIRTGRIRGRDAMVELLTLPVALAAGATLIGIVYVLVR